MASLNHLLVRACVAMFAIKPYTAPLKRFGTELHDRFMLPHYLAKDLVEVCTELSKVGFDLDPIWFEPQFNFKFPRIGSIKVDACELQLTTALEPWPVLGEEANDGQTARYVDSSTERLQVKLVGTDSARYHVLVNGVRLGMNSTGVKDEYVAGVRYRAWHPWSTLHPTIGVHSPITVELFDIETNTVVAAASYHVVHPGGRNFDERPQNESEAESRRSSRFDSSLVMPQHQSGSVKSASESEDLSGSALKVLAEGRAGVLQLVEPVTLSPAIFARSESVDFPTTLDLRTEGRDK